MTRTDELLSWKQFLPNSGGMATRGMGRVTPLMGTFTGQLLRGYSAYTIAVLNGFEGTEEEWLASLKGESGINIESVVVNDDLSIVISFADGTELHSPGKTPKLGYIIVQDLPSSGEPGIIYFIRRIHNNEDVYDYYIWDNNKFQKIGSSLDSRGANITVDVDSENLYL